MHVLGKVAVISSVRIKWLLMNIDEYKWMWIYGYKLEIMEVNENEYRIDLNKTEQ